MTRRVSTTLVSVSLHDLDQDDLVTYVKETYTPAEVFPESELEDWAKNSGYIKNPEA